MEQQVCAGDPTVCIRVRSGRLADIAFRAFDCPGARAAAGVLAILARGKSVTAAKAITQGDVMGVLGGSPEPVMRCANVGVTALHAAIAEWERDRLVAP